MAVWLLGMRRSIPYLVPAGTRSMTHPEAALCFRLGCSSKARRIGYSLIRCHNGWFLRTPKSLSERKAVNRCSQEPPSPLCFDRPCLRHDGSRSRLLSRQRPAAWRILCCAQLPIPRAPCYMPPMYRLFANGPRAIIEAAWDVLAWSCLLYTSPSPRDRG